ncbi:glycosyltransferase family 39 protein [Actinocorallia sp. API 0066]|uniref:glycosyltransferase family 39 protein n=1 Tax=Actinocorallia sp. API 0066 TaxID=2896846 RepID=UPI001E3D2311|nr:glycosyltransferase family 39 protein [Actinocorallia sp. API 0066]MCD0450745.1 glycosyltransferase family 39 protein [Actinocorallia sp. API 0066]
MSIIRSIVFGDPEQPRWARPVLWALLALTVPLYGWGLWAEPGRLPGAAFGVATVAVLYGAVRTAFGYGAATLAALVLALSPVAADASRTDTTGALAVLLFVGGAWAVTRALPGTAPLAPRLAGPFLVGAGVAVLTTGGTPSSDGARGLGWTVDDGLGGQLAWLLPFAVVSLAVGLYIVRGDRARTGALLLWGGWTVGLFITLSLGLDALPYALLAPAVAALAGIGAALMGRTGRPWPAVLAVCVAGTAVLAFVLLARTPDFHPWLRFALLALAAASAALMARKRLACGMATLTGLTAALAGPALFTLAVAGIITPA